MRRNDSELLPTRRIRAGSVLAALWLVAGCADLAGPNQRPLEVFWIEFPARAAEGSDFDLRVMASLSGCDRVEDLRVQRSDTVFVVIGVAVRTSQICIAEEAQVLRTIDTVVSTRAGDDGRFAVISGGRSFGRLDVEESDPGGGRTRAAGVALPVVDDGCVVVRSPVGRPIPEYPTTGTVSVPDSVSASSFMRGVLTADAPPEGCPSGLPTFDVESLELGF